MSHILLLREPVNDGSDRYERAFVHAGYVPVSIPVLTTVHDNVSSLVEILKNGPKTNNLDGVIITSKRSCEAWREALSVIRKSCPSNDVAGWGKVPFYVVGEATAASLNHTFSEFEDLGLGVVDVRGQLSGNAATLSSFILDDLTIRPAKLLYLTGDKNRDTLSKALEGGGLTLHSIQVYRTEGSPTFDNDLASVLASSSKESSLWWIVYFAPSAAAFVTPTLRKHFVLESNDYRRQGELIPTRIAAIGPTTNDFLRDNIKLRVHAMALKPTPEDIVSVILDFDREELE